MRDIAEIENVSLPYLSHFFRENMGMTFQDYLNDIRLESALLLIDNKNLNILDVFMESGFSDYRYLNKMFMRRFGCLPSMYRKQAQSIAPHASDNNTFVSQYLVPPDDSLKIILQKAEDFIQLHMAEGSIFAKTNESVHLANESN